MSRKNEPTKQYHFEIFRYDASRAAQPRFQAYVLEASGGISVLEALLKIQAEQDPSLAFRYACRGAICGSCAMSINGRLDLACRVLLEKLPARRVVLEPLPNYDVIKDLVLDMDPFWEKYEQVRPWLQAEVEESKERRMSEEDREKINQYVNCILCGLCYGACPVLASSEKFTGPAALAKLYRFVADAREERNGETLEREDGVDGVWGCHAITRCIQVCPRNVRPTDGIEGMRRKLLVHKLKKVMGGGR